MSNNVKSAYSSCSSARSMAMSTSSMLRLPRGPQLGWVVVVVHNVSALRAREVRKDVTSGLLLVAAKLVQPAVVRHLEQHVECSFFSRERDGGNYSGSGGLDHIVRDLGLCALA
jgi:hypothetical protein